MSQKARRVSVLIVFSIISLQSLTESSNRFFLSLLIFISCNDKGKYLIGETTDSREKGSCKVLESISLEEQESGSIERSH